MSLVHKALLRMKFCCAAMVVDQWQITKMIRREEFDQSPKTDSPA
jgi:hypothetical protein